MHASIRKSLTLAAPAVILAVSMSACAGGLVGSKEKKLAYFNSLEQDTLGWWWRRRRGSVRT